jgi:hypothetical protein
MSAYNVPDPLDAEQYSTEPNKLTYVPWSEEAIST